jgi:hypothetical protein
MKKNLILRSVAFLILIAMTGTMFLVNSCNNDKDEVDIPEVSPLPGKYEFKSATLSAPLELMPGVSFPAGFDMTGFVRQGLFSATPCNDAANTQLELKESGDLYYVCKGEANELKVGTWSSTTDMSQLNLNLSSPPLPGNLSLALNNLIVNSSGLTASVDNLPIPIAIFSDLIPDGVDISMLPEALIVNIVIAFDKAN